MMVRKRTRSRRSNASLTSSSLTRSKLLRELLAVEQASASGDLAPEPSTIADFIGESQVRSSGEKPRKKS